MQPGVQPRQGRRRAEGLFQGGGQGVAPGLVGHPAAGQMPGEIPLPDKAGQGLLLKAAHRAGVQAVPPAPGRQQVGGQDHIGDADARSQAAGHRGQIDHRAVGPGHPLQAGQRAGIEAELRVVVVLDDVPPARALGRPAQQLRPAGGGHGHPGGELVAGGDVADRRIRRRQRRHRQPALVHRHQPAGAAAVFQHLPGPGIAGVFHRRRTRQQRGQQAEQMLDARPHDDLLRRAAHPAVFFQVACQGLAQLHLSPRVPSGQQAGGGIQQLFLQPRPGPRREQPGVHPTGGQIVPHRGIFGRRGGGQRRRRSVLPRGGRPGRVFLYIKAAAGAAGQIAFGGQHLIGPVHRVHRDGQRFGQAAPAGHPGAGGQGARADLPGDAAVELFVQRHLGRRVQRGGQMEHGSPSFSNWPHKKVVFWVFSWHQFSL